MSTQTINTYAFRQLESTSSTGGSPAEVVARAQTEADAIREGARADGHAAGYAAGLQLARSEASEGLAALADAARVLADTREELAETLTVQAAELALLTAEHIIAGAIEAEPERIVDVVRGALRRLSDRHRVTALVNPEDLEVLVSSSATLQAQLGGIEHLDVQADRRIARGGTVVQTAFGEIDVTISAQLQSAREIIAGALTGGAPGSEARDGDAGTAELDETPEPLPGDDER